MAVRSQDNSPTRRAVASAPATWVLAGENADYYGGVTIVGLSDLRVRATASPREDSTLHLEVRSISGPSLSAEGELASLVDDPSPDNPYLTRIAGLVQTLISRQVLSRDTSGLDISVESDIPLGAGLGALHSADAAIALALAQLGSLDDIDDAPARARLADLCASSALTHSSLPILRSRYTAALRGAGETVSVIDYADGSVTQAPHPARTGVRIFSISDSLGRIYTEGAQQIAERRRFFDDASANFGVSSLRQLPDAASRVVEWVKARRDVLGPDSTVAPDIAEAWVRAAEEENKRSQAVSSALRSHKNEELHARLNLPVEDALVTLAVEHGATSARPAAAGMSAAAIALVPLERADAFYSELSADHQITEIRPGEVARVEKN